MSALVRAAPGVRAAALAALLAAPALAGDYEIQIYPGQTTDPGATFVELHSNTANPGPRAGEDPALQSDSHAFHETLEITRGFTPWFETGFYTFSSARSGDGWAWVGNHIRPRVAAPASWGWPVGVSLSAEAGYLRPRFSESRWDLELRPIVDWRRGGFYVSFNPAFERVLRPYPGADTRFVFSPQLKLSCDAFRYGALGVEYYGVLGPVESPLPAPMQQHQLYPTVDLINVPGWEVNAGLGVGLTRATDVLTLKLILGRRF